MYWHLTLIVLFESCIFREYADRSRNRCWVMAIAQNTNNLWLIGPPDWLAEWVEHPSPVLGDQGIRTSWLRIQTLCVRTLVESKQWLKNWYLLLPSLVLSFIKIRQGLVGQCQDIMNEWNSRSWCRWPGVPVRQHYKVTMSTYCHNFVPVLIWP